MEQEVYADLYILINFGMDMICLTITATLLHCRIKRLRLFLAALTGGLYALFSLLWGMGGLAGILLDCLAAAGLCAIAFLEKRTTLSRILRLTGVYLLTSVLLGGAMTALYSLLNRLELPFDQVEGDGISVWTFALLTTVAGFFTLRGGKWFGMAKRTQAVTVTATLFGKEVTLRALVDSGNLLKDPITGKSVIVAEEKKLREILPPALQAANGWEHAALLSDYELARQIRLIPTHTATGSRVLPAVIPSSLTVTCGKDTYAADYLIALSSLGSSRGDFDAVISLH